MKIGVIGAGRLGICFALLCEAAGYEVLVSDIREDYVNDLNDKKIITTDYLLTNFHLPKSTLFILVCSYAGIKIMHNAYVHAISNEYRFYSLGDACLIKKNNNK